MKNDPENKVKAFADWNESENEINKKIDKLTEACEKSLNTSYWNSAFKDQLAKAEQFFLDKE